MARAAKNPKIDTRSARAKLAPQREPYWIQISPGCALGFRKGSTGGSWIARRYDPASRPVRRFLSLGAADDVEIADGVLVLSFATAHERAREWFTAEALKAQGLDPQPAGPFTVGDALDAYLTKLDTEGRASLGDARSRCRTTIRPALGSVALERLTAAQLRRFLDDIAKRPRLVRGKRGAAARETQPADTDAARRSRRSNANRTWTTLRAALNNAFADGRVASDAAWRRVAPLRNADTARTGYLAVDEAQRLVNACPPDFRDLVTAALLCGARYAELGRLSCEDFDPAAGTLRIGQSKSGKARQIYLSTEAQTFFAAQVLGKARGAAMLPKADGSRWRPSQQRRPMAAALTAARIDTALTFHGLRHSYASAAVMNGTALPVIAHNLGHADTRMVEKHYGHLAPTWLAEATRASAPVWGLGVAAGNVEPMRRATT